MSAALVVGEVHAPGCRACAERLEIERAKARDRGEENSKLRKRLRAVEEERDRLAALVAALEEAA